MKFKVGDIVIVKGNCMGKSFHNELGKVISNKEFHVGVEFFKKVPGFHSCQKTGKDGYCWNVNIKIVKKLLKLKLKKLLEEK